MFKIIIKLKRKDLFIEKRISINTLRFSDCWKWSNLCKVKRDPNCFRQIKGSRILSRPEGFLAHGGRTVVTDNLKIALSQYYGDYKSLF